MWEPQSGDSRQTDVLLNSSLESVDKAEQLVSEAARSMGFGDDDVGDIAIAVREAAVNAVAHGNRYSGKKKVRLQVWTAAGRLAVSIGDEGNGFQAIGIPDPLAGENLMKQSGRGLLMVRAYMDEFHVAKREPTGTEVVLVKYLREGAS